MHSLASQTDELDYSSLDSMADPLSIATSVYAALKGFKDVIEQVSDLLLKMNIPSKTSVSCDKTRKVSTNSAET